MTLARWLTALGFAALAIGACSVEHRSGDFTCDDHTACADNRTCVDGLCVRTDAPPPDAAACPPACTSCVAGTRICTIDCGLNGGCKQQVTCPTGWSCDVLCNQASSCRNGVSCLGSTSCTISCSSALSCTSVSCGLGPCKVDCSGTGSCREASCGSSCACDVTCHANSSCGNVTCKPNCASTSPFGGCTSLDLPGCSSCR